MQVKEAIENWLTMLDFMTGKVCHTVGVPFRDKLLELDTVVYICYVRVTYLRTVWNLDPIRFAATTAGLVHYFFLGKKIGAQSSAIFNTRTLQRTVLHLHYEGTHTRMSLVHM